MQLKIDRSNWKKVKLGDVAFEYSKRINNPSDSVYDRFIGSSNIGQWDFRIKSWESTSSVTSAMKLFEPDDYLLVRRSLYASDFRERAPRANFYGVCSGDILTIKENKKYIADGFLIGILNSPALWKYVVANGSGSITRRIHWKDLANYEFLLPPKDEQVRLAELLWAMDEVIEKEKEVLEKLEKYLVGIDNEYLKVDSNTPLRKVITKTINGGTPSTDNKSFYINGTIPWITTKTINNDYTYVGEKLITLEAIEKSAAKILPKGNIIAGTRVGVGKFSINEVDISFSQDINGLYVDKEIVDTEFLVFQLNSNIFQNKIFPLLRGTTIKGILKDDLLNLNICLPNLRKQIEYADKIKRIKKAIKQLLEKKINSQSLQKSLINQLF